ncbi:MAG TPA: hypothetical protein VMS40_08145, partial [Vicinamibacterales bacterium]|nr:hypothetical protein [Vicinamibacterales bacterium]
RIERGALRARVQLSATPGAATVEPDLLCRPVAALSAPDHVAEARHVDVAGAILRDPARACRRSWFRRWTGRGGSWRPIAVVVPIASLAVLPVTH